ncbi:MAG: PEP-CTERM sorting domain-containing protein [Thermoguttaceae bacterium]
MGVNGNSANGISGNNIVGYYVDSANDYHGYIVTVPEPSTFVLLSVGTIGLLGYRWRQRKQSAQNHFSPPSVESRA